MKKKELTKEEIIKTEESKIAEVLNEKYPIVEMEEENEDDDEYYYRNRRRDYTKEELREQGIKRFIKDQTIFETSLLRAETVISNAMDFNKGYIQEQVYPVMADGMKKIEAAGKVNKLYIDQNQASLSALFYSRASTILDPIAAYIESILSHYGIYYGYNEQQRNFMQFNFADLYDIHNYFGLALMLKISKDEKDNIELTNVLFNWAAAVASLVVAKIDESKVKHSRNNNTHFISPVTVISDEKIIKIADIILDMVFLGLVTLTTEVKKEFIPSGTVHLQFSNSTDLEAKK